MTILGTTAQEPDGSLVPLPVSGAKINRMTPLAANASWNTGWMDISSYPTLQIFVNSNVNGTYTYEWSEAANGVPLIRPASVINYIAANASRPALFPTLASYLRLTYTNGSTAQTTFEFTVRAHTEIVGTLREAEEELTNTNLLLAAHAQLSAVDDTTLAPSKLYSKSRGLHVYVDNPGLTDTQLRATPLPVSQPTTGTVTTVTSTGTAQNALAANSSRKGASFYGVSGTVLLRVGATATTSLYTIKIQPNGFYELPKPANTAVISVIGTGVLNVTEEV